MRKVYFLLSLMGTTALVSSSASATAVLPAGKSFFSRDSNVYNGPNYYHENSQTPNKFVNSSSGRIDQEAFMKALTEAFQNALKIVYRDNEKAINTFLLGQQKLHKSSQAFEQNEEKRARIYSRTFSRTRNNASNNASTMKPVANNIPTPPKMTMSAPTLNAPTQNKPARSVSLGSLLSGIQNFNKDKLSSSTLANSSQNPVKNPLNNELLAKIAARGKVKPVTESNPVTPVIKPIKTAPKVIVKGNGNTPPPPPSSMMPPVTVKNIKSDSLRNPLLAAIEKGTKLNDRSKRAIPQKSAPTHVDLAATLNSRFKKGLGLNKVGLPVEKKKESLEELKAKLTSAEESLLNASNLLEKQRLKARISDIKDSIAEKENLIKQTSSTSAKAALVKKANDAAKNHSVSKKKVSSEAKKKISRVTKTLKKTRINELKDRSLLRSKSMGTVDRSAAIAEIEKKRQESFQKGTQSLVENGYKVVAEQKPETVIPSVQQTNEVVKAPEIDTNNQVVKVKATPKKADIKLDENGVPIPPMPPVEVAKPKPAKLKRSNAFTSKKAASEGNIPDLLASIRNGKELKKTDTAAPVKEEPKEEEAKVKLGTTTFTLSKKFSGIFNNGFDSNSSDIGDSYSDFSDSDDEWDDEDDWYNENKPVDNTAKTTNTKKDSSQPTLKKAVSSPAIIMTAPKVEEVDQAETRHKTEAEKRSKVVSLRIKQNASKTNNSRAELLDQIQGFSLATLETVDEKNVQEGKKLFEEKENSLKSDMQSKILARRAPIDGDDDDDDWD